MFCRNENPVTEIGLRAEHPEAWGQSMGCATPEPTRFYNPVLSDPGSLQ